MKYILTLLLAITSVSANSTPDTVRSPISELNVKRFQIIKKSAAYERRVNTLPHTHSDGYTLLDYQSSYGAKTHEATIYFILSPGSEMPDWEYWANHADNYKFQVGMEKKSFEDIQETHGFANLELCVYVKDKNDKMRQVLTYDQKKQTWTISLTDSEEDKRSLNRDGTAKFRKTRDEARLRQMDSMYRKQTVTWMQNKHSDNPNIIVGYNTEHRSLIFDILNIPKDEVDMIPAQELVDRYVKMVGETTIAQLINDGTFDDVIINIPYINEERHHIKCLSLIYEDDVFLLDAKIDSREMRPSLSVPDRMLINTESN